MVITKKSSYLALYRKWRPKTFSQMVNQDYTVKTLKNSIARGEIAHAYLFAGPRGTGKTSAARIFAKSVNCLDPKQGEPCNLCENCDRISRGKSLDTIEIDGASNRGIDQIRELREEVNFVPADTQYKVYIIDEVHMLTQEAFNALLKTLEEPPEQVIFIFATTQPEKILPTVISRCQTFEFKNIVPELIEKRLEEICEKEEIEATDKALSFISRKAEGSMRDALVILEQIASYKEKGEVGEEDLLAMMGLASEEVLVSFLKSYFEKNVKGVLKIIDDLAKKGKDIEFFTDNLVKFIHDSLFTHCSEDESQPLFSADFGDWVSLASRLLDIKRRMIRSWDKRVILEIGLLELMGVDKLKPAKKTKEEPQKLKEDQEPQEPQEELEKEKEFSTSSNSASEAGTEVGKWDELLEEIKKDRISVYAFLSEGNPLKESGKLKIEFDPQYKFHKESLEKKENRKFLKSKISQVYGPCELEIAMVEKSESPEQPKRKESEDQLKRKAEMIKEAFDGEIIT